MSRQEAYGHVWASVPEYDGLRFDATGSRHVFLAEGEGARVMLRKWPIAMSSRHESSENGSARGFEFHYTPDGSVSGEDSGPVLEETLGADKVRLHASREQMLSSLERILNTATVGLRLYVGGPEVFLWTVAKVARKSGLDAGEVQLELVGDASRRVYCAHCRNFTEGVTSNVTECQGCGEPLEVLPHFSRFWNAYLGFKADAEEPGNVPEPTESFEASA